jgi:hypothetical protein
MRRQHPLITTLGFLATGILIAGIGLAVWSGGGAAFSPGRLTDHHPAQTPLGGFSSHAEFEGQCSLCHAPLEMPQDLLCQKCHAEIADQRQTGNGTHGHLTDASHCAACHADHRGRDFEPVRSAFEGFDHARTHFNLIWHQVNYDAARMNCEACHTFTPVFQVLGDECQACHARKDGAFMDQHMRDFGSGCLNCHDGVDRMKGFDHTKTGFELTGKHRSIACADCHSVAKAPADRVQAVDLFKGAPTDCVGCHREPQVHQGMFGPDCSVCHTTASWSPASFENKPFAHLQQAGFSLAKHTQKADGSALVCRDCHSGDVHKFDPAVCVACHSQGQGKADWMKQHQARYGPVCKTCHDGVDRLHDFNHNTFFALTGKHADLTCEGCHAERKFRGLPSECSACHQEPKIHAGAFGLKCQYCHSTSVWTPARLQVHNFPLDHGKQKSESNCKTCHTGSYDQYTCYGCHDHQPAAIQDSHYKLGVSSLDLPDCTRCHPGGRKTKQP